MQVLLDHLSSILIGGAVMLSLIANQASSQHATIEQTVSHSVKAKTIVFGSWVENDILNLGANFGRNLYRFSEPALDAHGNSAAWEFYSDSIRADGSKLRDYTRYRLVLTENAVFQDTTYQMYSVQRDTAAVNFVGTSVARPAESAWARNIWSIGTVSFFQIQMLDYMGETPRLTDGSIDVDKVDYIRVHFGVVPEYVLRPDNYLRELYWARTLKVRPYWAPPPA